MMPLARALRVVGDAEELAATAAAHFVRSAQRAVAARGQFTVALAGGRSPRRTYEKLAETAEQIRVDWPRVRVFFGDERAVPPDDAASNYGAAWAALLSKVPVAAANVHRMKAERSDLERAADEYADELRRAVAADASGTPEFDLVLMGMGEDAHVLSLYPGCALIDDDEVLVGALRRPPMNPAVDRLTLGPRVLRAARELVLIASGKGKAKALADAIGGADDAARVPAQLLRRARGEASVYADRDASGG